MKLLLDSCVWGPAQVELKAAGHDVVWAGDWPHDPGDDEILARACAEGRILVTLDKDFGELAVLRGRKHCGIMRLVGLSAKQQASVCLTAVGRHGLLLLGGGIVTAEQGRLRIRPSPGGPTAVPPA